MTLYRRFPRREDVISALILREARAVIAKVEAAINASEGMHERIIEGFLIVVRDLAGHKLTRRLLMSDPDILLPLLTIEAGPLITVGRQFLAKQIELARERGDEFGLGAPDHVAELIARIILSLLLTPSSTLPLGDERALRELALRTIVPLIVRI
jgi:AcrR family transcriptional regulator